MSKSVKGLQLVLSRTAQQKICFLSGEHQSEMLQVPNATRLGIFKCPFQPKLFYELYSVLVFLIKGSHNTQGKVLFSP